jgi:hypothetical protein
MPKTPLAGALTLVAAMTASAAAADGPERAAVPGPNDYGTASLTAVTYGHAGMTPMFDSEWIWSSATPDGWSHRTGGNATGTCAVLPLPPGALVEGVTTFTNDSDGNFGPSFAGPLPTSGVQALRFTGTAAAPSSNNAADYALTDGAAVVTNNARNSFTVNEPPPPVTGACCVAGECQQLSRC